MRADKRKVVIVGTGMVGMSYAYCRLNQSVCDELVLIDVNKKRAEAVSYTHLMENTGITLENSTKRTTRSITTIITGYVTAFFIATVSYTHLYKAVMAIKT